MSTRRVLYRPDQVRRLVAGMREDLRDLRFKHLREMADLRRELDEVRNDYIRLRDAVRARHRAEAELADLRRQRNLVEAWASERDPATQLQ